MNDLNTLYTLQTKRLDFADCIRLFEIDHQRFLKALTEYERALVASDLIDRSPEEKIKRLQKEELVRSNIKIAIDYYYRCAYRLPFESSLLDSSHRFVEDELKSYPTSFSIALQTKEWAKEQGLNVYLDSVEINGIEYYRVLSRPWLQSQVSIAGVVFQRNEIVDIPHRPMQSLAKLLERVDHYCHDHQ